MSESEDGGGPAGVGQEDDVVFAVDADQDAKDQAETLLTDLKNSIKSLAEREGNNEEFQDVTEALLARVKAAMHDVRKLGVNYNVLVGQTGIGKTQGLNGIGLLFDVCQEQVSMHNFPLQHIAWPRLASMMLTWNLMQYGLNPLKRTRAGQISDEERKHHVYAFKYLEQLLEAEASREQRRADNFQEEIQKVWPNMRLLSHTS